MSSLVLIAKSLKSSYGLLKELVESKEKTNKNSDKVIKNITSMYEEYYEVDKLMYDNGEEYFLLYYVPAGCDGRYKLTVSDYVQHTTYEKIDDGNVWKPVTSEIKYEHVKYRNMNEVKKSLMQHKKGRIKYRGKVIAHLVEIIHNKIQAFSIAWIIVGLDKRFWSAEEAIEYIDNVMFHRNEGTYFYESYENPENRYLQDLNDSQGRMSRLHSKERLEACKKNEELKEEIKIANENIVKL